MTDVDTPAGRTGGGTPTPTPAELAASLPDRLRVHALARLLSVTSREVLTTLAELGIEVRSAQSGIDRDAARRAIEALLPTPAEADTDQPVGPAIDTTDEGRPAGRREPDADAVDDPGAPAVPLAPLFAPPAPATKRTRRASRPAVADEGPADSDAATAGAGAGEAEQDTDDEDRDEDRDDTDGGAARRRRRRGRRGRGRGRGGQQDDSDDEDSSDDDAAGTDAADDSGTDSDDGGDGDDGDDAEGPGDGSAASRRRRRRRRRKSGGDDDSRDDDPPNTVVHVRESAPKDSGRDSRSGDDEVRAIRGSTRLEAKRQRRRDGREAGRRRAPVLSESEFLARRESVERRMVVREEGERIEIAVLEDGVLVEHFVTSSGSGSMVGNVYLGRVQNVLPSMEAAFVDIGRGRNAVLYAGEVDWDAAGLEGKARKIEQALSSGDSVLVQVTKDPVGHKGARLTTQISLPGRFLVYVPAGGATGISRKLPDNERRRLKDILKRVVPDDVGVIIRTASEGIAEDDLARDVRRLQAQWEVIQEKSQSSSVKAPALLYEEPDLLVKVVRDLFTEDFSQLVVQGDDAWDTIDAYVSHVAPDLVPRLRRSTSTKDVFTEFRIDEQIAKALDRKVWLPSGGYLILDRTEAMTVIDVNTGKFTGSGGNLEETVTRNNLEAAEEIVRQLRLRDIGGIIVIDFIDMVLESNRDLVLRRLTECLGRDRTRHQVAEVTSLGLVQMTRKRVGTGLLEAYSTPCEHCRGRGVVVSSEPIVDGRAAQQGGGQQGGGQQGGRRSGGRSGGGKSGGDQQPAWKKGVDVPESAPPPAPMPGPPPDAGMDVPAAEPTGPEPADPDTAVPETVGAEPAGTEPARAAEPRETEPDSREPAPAASAAASASPEPDAAPVPGDSSTSDVAAVPSDSSTSDVAAPEPAEPDEPREPQPPRRRRRRAASRPAGPPAAGEGASPQTSVTQAG